MIESGNAFNAAATRGWIVGTFMPEVPLKSSRVEVKWGNHPRGDSRPVWVTDDKRTTLLICVSGCFALELPHKEFVLENPGDYVSWGPGIDHSWRAIEDSVVVTVRWWENLPPAE